MRRTTKRPADRLAAHARREAAARGVSVSAFTATTPDDALKRGTPAEPPEPFRLITAGGRGLRPGIQLDRPRALEVADDEARFARRGS